LTGNVDYNLSIIRLTCFILSGLLEVLSTYVIMHASHPFSMKILGSDRRESRNSEVPRSNLRQLHFTDAVSVISRYRSGGSHGCALNILVVSPALAQL
jgi:hypothetical protein